MKKIIDAIKEFFSPFAKEVKQTKFLAISDDAKSYCYYHEDSNGNPTVAISGSNVFTIVSGETNLEKREIGVEDAKKFVANERREYITHHFINPCR